jgi:hypothetical protein
LGAKRGAVFTMSRGVSTLVMVRFRAFVAALLAVTSLGAMGASTAGGQPTDDRLSSAPSIVANPRVTGIGDPVTASGNCAGSPHLTVTGQPAGWYDIPPDYIHDVTLFPDPAGNWLTVFPMPPTPSTVSVLCSQGLTTEGVVMSISPSDHVRSLGSGQPDGGGIIVTIPDVLSPEQLVAFTATGSLVPVAVLAFVSQGAQVRVESPGAPVRIVIIGVESLGENANARQNSRVQGWSLDVGAINGGASTSGLAPAVRIP